MKRMNWHKPGIFIKRWILMGIIGIFLVIIGLYPYLSELLNQGLQIRHLYFLILLIGVSAIIISIWKTLGTLIRILGLSHIKDLFNNKLNERRGSKGCKIVVIGGGTGLSVILRGIKEITTNITAIVTTTDDGGGSGILRADLGMLPPGDIRSCILALADTEEDMQELIQYRFREGRLSGQSLGNLLIAALTDIYDSFQEAVAKVHEILAVKGRVIPVTDHDVQLCAELQNGTIVTGESNIPETVLRTKSSINRVFLKPENPMPLEGAVEIIENADIIVLGPGSLYTSIIPNLLVSGITDAISNSRAKKIYIANVMTQPGETDRYSLYDHLRAVYDHAGEKLIDYIIVNNEKMTDLHLKKYKEDGAEQVIMTRKEARKLKREGIQIIEGPFIDIKQGYIRHDADAIADTIKALHKKEKN